MDGIEQAIRRALAKGNDDDRTFREKVYRSAFAALDRSLKEKPELTVENAIKRRKALQATVKAIETEYVPAMAPEPVVASAPASLAPSVAPELRADRRVGPVDAASRLEPELAAPARRPVRLDQARTARERKPRKRGSGRMLSIATGLVILAVIGTGLWWAYANFGHFIGADMRQIEAAINESRGQSGPPALSADGASADAGWTTIFEPADIELVAPPEGASAEATQDEAGSYMRIRSGASGAPIAFTVGQNLLDRFAGQRVVFNIVARGIEGEGTQISVECDFGALGNCGRTRYDVGTTQEDHLFEVALPQGSAANTSTITVNTDVTGAGRGVDIFAILMRPAE
ncbi:hypothetical protein [Aliihoeflea sp. 40Bstr573]|uniref:hypothetical protein n=1 Tax=Aliihoeflea sp. 40Bstr573 TaxID=2696467 RepID=UPI0020963848|nr:hypothetical protein [Aliihoeflea sp. 40Bstr573]MCO6388312.1 hypothetical protein [Aliihoeflea sp. 40Bstr573]